MSILPVTMPMSKQRARLSHSCLSVSVCVPFNCSAGIRDAAGVGHFSHHVSRVADLCGSGLDICLPVDEEENSK